MASRTIYTRVFSSQSAGQLVSGKGRNQTGEPLPRTDLEEEFRKHSDRGNRVPTALVSVSNRIVDTVQRAFDKCCEPGVSTADIWIAFIEEPAAAGQRTSRIHSARDLARRCGLSEPDYFQHEFVFEWAIPNNYVLHRVSLQTLVDRGLDWNAYLFPTGTENFPVATKYVRFNIAEDLLGSCHDPMDGAYDIGVFLGSFARKFGAGAPLGWIAKQLFYDCINFKEIPEVDDDLRVMLSYGRDSDERSLGVDLGDFDMEVEKGEDAVIEWWLNSDEFEVFDLWRDEMEERMQWDLVDLWEASRGRGYGAYDERPLGGNRDKETMEWKALWVKHAEMRADIEAEAVRIGL